MIPPDATREPDLEAAFLLPLAAPWVLGEMLGEWLGRPLGPRPGWLIGRLVSVVLGGVPLAYGCLLLVLVRLAARLVAWLDRPLNRTREAGEEVSR